jgi:hypothetical protein
MEAAPIAYMGDGLQQAELEAPSSTGWRASGSAAYFAPDRFDLSRSLSMRVVFLIVLLFGFLTWDIAENSGHYTHMISGEIGDLGGRLGLR